ALMAIGFVTIVYNIYYSFKNSPRDIGSDPWDARSLEWATHTPVPEYNFARVPQVASSEAFWDMKKKGHQLFKGEIKDIHMPNNSGVPFVMGIIFFIAGFSFIFAMWVPAVIALIGIFVCMALRSFEQDHGRHIHVKEIKEIEAQYGEVPGNENRSHTTTRV